MTSVLATAAVGFTLTLSGCAATCNAACQRVINACKFGCPTTIGAYAGYDLAKSYCADHPGESGCLDLP
jgi:hypothetical protein